MITQVLNREFVLQQLELVRDELAKPASRRRSDSAHSLSKNERQETAAFLQQSFQRELAASSGQQGYELKPARRGSAVPPPIDDQAFISHEPGISLLQSALTEYFLTQAPSRLSEPSKPSGRRNAKSAPAFDPIGATSIKGLDVKPASGRRVFDKYSETDPRWIASVVAMGVRAFKKRHPFNPTPAEPIQISKRARLILVADWGSGLPRAVAVANEMRKIVEEGKRTGLEQHVMHLGDVYYSGCESEYVRNFLPHWPVRSGEASKQLYSWCLNGNHDMYAGGHAYYDYLLAEPRFSAHQQSSFFSLHNDDWDIFGIDTAHEDGGLHDPQLEWLKSKRSGSPRRSMLLSHHQLFSAYEGPSKILARKVGGYLEANPVDVWFWGHEHRCVFYREHAGVKHARLIGHGGVPVYMNHGVDDPYPTPAFYQYREYKQTWLEKWALFGFAVVDLDGKAARVRYIDEFGTQHAEEVL